MGSFFYYDTRTNGEILSVITNDVESVNTAIGKNLFERKNLRIIRIRIIIVTNSR